MPLDKKHARVANKYGEKRVKRFFAMCRAADIDGESTKEYYKRILEVPHLDDMNDEQWDFVFTELEDEIKKNAEKTGAIFAKDMDEVMDLLLK